MLVEGKWGHLGRYLHRPEDYPYNTSWTYHRSRRGGHLLAGLAGTPPS
jgi:hypothetical protein